MRKFMVQRLSVDLYKKSCSGGGKWRKMGEGPSRNMDKRHMDKVKEGGFVGGRWGQVGWVAVVG